MARQPILAREPSAPSAMKASLLARLLLVLCWSFSVAAAVPSPEHSFVFPYEHGPAIMVWVHVPSAHDADTPVIVVMHGVRRNGREYRDQWRALSEQFRFLLVVPEFSRADFPGAERYNLGGVFDADGRRAPETRWTYSYLEPLFDVVRERYQLTAAHYGLYGHSAGAQFVHRFALYNPDARAAVVVAANAGWYQMPDASERYPYGLQLAGVDAAALPRFLARRMVVLLGEADTDSDHRSLRQTPAARAQGPDRLSRGRAFFAAGAAAACAGRVEFGWQLALVPGVGHDNSKMAAHAIDFLLTR